MPAENLRELFIDELKDVYDAELRLTQALPKMAAAATAKPLAAAFKRHLKQTEGHVTRLESVLTSLGASTTRKTCKAMLGILAEGDEMMKEEAPPAVKDVMLIAAAQKVEHYEIATYKSLCAWAVELEEDTSLEQLEASLNDETTADDGLTELALSLVPESNDSEEDEGVMAHAKRPNGGKRR